MNKPLFHLVAFMAIILSCVPQRSSANNAGGGEIIYEWLTDSTYRFYFKLYRDCAGSPEPASVTMCVQNTCNAFSFTRTLPQLFNPNPVPWPPVPAPYCSQYKTQCDSPASAIPGRKVVWYTDVFTLPSRCNYWSFSVTVPGRPASNTIANAGGTDMYIEATLNNTGSYQGNNSAYFAVTALPFVCHNMPYMYNNGAVDPDNDSVTTEVIYPLNANGACPAPPVNATFASVTPPLSMPNNPVNTGNTFSLNSATGQFAFTSAQQGPNTLAFRINEYRNGVKISSVMREASFHTLSCAPQTTIGLIPGGCPVAGGLYVISPTGPAYEACTQNFSFCFSVKAVSDPNAKLVVNINNNVSAPGSVVTYTNPFTDSVGCLFSWTPSSNDTGLKILSVTVTDTVCKFPGIMSSQTFTIPVFIWSRTRTTADTMNICTGTPAQLGAIGGNNFQWTVLNGTPGSLSCSNCQNPVATPTASSQYVVTSTINPFCPYITDTVTVNVLPVTYPNVNITVSPDTNVWPGLNVTFTAAGTACTNAVYQWRKNGADIPGANSATWSTTTLADMDVITCLLTCNDSCALPKDTLSNTVTMHVATSVETRNRPSALNIYPNPNKGEFTIVDPSLANVEEIEAEVWNNVGQLLYRTNLNKTSAETSVKIKIPEIVPGVYRLSIKTPAGLRSTPFTVID